MNPSTAPAFAALVAIGVMLPGIVQRAAAQVRITEVNITTRKVELTNFGASSVSLSGWFFCHRFTYPSLSGTIGAGQSVQFTVNFNQTSSDLGLFTSSAFATPSAMEDFVQWGAGGLGRESVAVAKGIWASAAFIPVPASGLSLHAKAQPAATGSRVANWFAGLPHAGFPVPAPVLESGAMNAGAWSLTVSSFYLPAALKAEVAADLSGAWTVTSATATDLGGGRVKLVFPASLAGRQFTRVRAQP